MAPKEIGNSSPENDNANSVNVVDDDTDSMKTTVEGNMNMKDAQNGVGDIREVQNGVSEIKVGDESPPNVSIDEGNSTIRNSSVKSIASDNIVDNKESQEEGEYGKNSGTFSPVIDKTHFVSNKSIEDCLKIAEFSDRNVELKDHTVNDDTKFISESYRKDSRNYMLESKLNQLNREYELKDSKLRNLIDSGSSSIRQTFNHIKSTVGKYDEEFINNVDFEFWAAVVNDYDSVILNNADELNRHITKGIPPELRGIIWQLIARSKNYHLEELYYHLKTENSSHDKAIMRDLTRTSFFTSIDQASKGEELFNVIKAYSLFDPDVGYTQGMIFITVPLVMNMNESESFCFLTTLMKDYNLRSVFCPDMDGLHLLLFKFDRLLERNLPLLYNYLMRLGIKSSMYASQWFLTFFAYKFPLEMVLRIYDILITEGIESILKFALNLMMKHEKVLLQLNFDKLLEFLKTGLFNCYVNDQYVDHHKKTGGPTLNDLSKKRFTMFGRKANNVHPVDYYKLDQLIEDSLKVNISPLELHQFESEFEAIYQNEKKKVKEIEIMKAENGNLRHLIKLLEMDYISLNGDYVDLVQKLVNVKVVLPETLVENETLQKAVDDINMRVKELENATDEKNEAGDVSSTLPADIENDVQKVLAINAEETEKYANLEEELSNLQEEYSNMTSQILSLRHSKKWFPGWKSTKKA